MRPMLDINTDPAPKTWRDFEIWYKDHPDKFPIQYDDFIELPFSFQAGIFLDFFESKYELLVFIRETESDMQVDTRFYKWELYYSNEDGSWEKEFCDKYFFEITKAFENATIKAFDTAEKKINIY